MSYKANSASQQCATTIRILGGAIYCTVIVLLAGLVAISAVSTLSANTADPVVPADRSTTPRILFVSKLSDNPADPIPGELRHALSVETGPRIVIFRTGGVIHLKGTLFIRSENSHVYVAGQSAPGGGIVITGANRKAATNDLIRLVDTSHVGLSHLRLRLGKGNTPGRGDNVSIIRSHHIELQNLSISWSNDENVGIWANEEGESSHITLMDSLLAAPNPPHATNMIVAPHSYVEDGQNVYRSIDKIHTLDIHRNVFAHATHRNPLVVARNARVSNNVIYNWKYFSFAHLGHSEVDFEKNLLIEGPVTDLKKYAVYARQAFTFDVDNRPLFGYRLNDPRVFWLQPGSIFHHANRIDYNDSRLTDGPFDEWSEYLEIVTLRIPTYACDGTDFRCHLNSRRTKALPPNGARIYVPQTMTEQLKKSVLRGAGASSRLSCVGSWESNRDLIDQQIISDLESKTDSGIPGAAIIEKYKREIDPGLPCIDNDNDGVPDEFERLRGANATEYDAFTDADKNGAVLVEEYLQTKIDFLH